LIASPFGNVLDKRAGFLQSSADMKTTITPLKHSMNRSPVRLALLLIPLALACFALSPQAQATCQQGCFTEQSTALGDDALLNGAVANTAIGFEALFSNTDGTYNTGVGAFALQFNTTGYENTAIGYGALPYNTTGIYNTATGRSALYANTSGIKNTATGYTALYYNTTGGYNTAIGENALARNTIGSNNIGVGADAGLYLNKGSNNIDIGNSGVPRESDTIRIGKIGTQTNAYIAGISGATVPTGVPVIVDTTGYLGTTTSSARFKEAIKPMDKASEAVLALKPVTFRYKKELDAEGIPQFGLVAEEVEKVNPDLVARDNAGQPYTVRYEAVNAMLLNEFLKEHCRVEELQAEFVQQRQDFQVIVGRQQKQIEALTSGLQKVSAQLELSKPATQTALNDK